ncbi:hypothetical protein [Paenibacillus tundrae]|uniref:Uncharacterized protein n=1 Tax=Paenibacillus tundrae TaxID=528187 RepID=A0ABT9W6M5_9BACL|nr:hypothetical protein [Paenibacillus tundrae]MDQ0168737.1 hypothetical protein [Paenibacillus tundrae]
MTNATVEWNYADIESSINAMETSAEAPVFYIQTGLTTIDSIELSVGEAEEVIAKMRGMLDEIYAKRKQEPRRLAEVLPFVPRPTPESIAQMELVSLLERYTEMARSGEITGEIVAEYVNVNTRERTLLIEELRELSFYEYDV